PGDPGPAGRASYMKRELAGKKKVEYSRYVLPSLAKLGRAGVSKDADLSEGPKGGQGRTEMGVDFPFGFEKALEAVVYLASKGIPDFDKYKVCKLLFLADKYHLVRYGRPITGDRYYAMPYGPAPTTLLTLLSRAVEHGDGDARVEALVAALTIDKTPL